MIKGIISRLNLELQDAYNNLERDKEYINDIILNQKDKKLETGEDVYDEVIGWDLTQETDHALFESGVVCGLYLAINVIKDLQNKKGENK